MIYLCERLPHLKTWFENELDTPRSLKRCCRSAIRGHISADRIKDVYEMEIPRFLQDFLLCKDITEHDVALTF